MHNCLDKVLNTICCCCCWTELNCCCSVAQSCATLWDPGTAIAHFPVHHYLLEFVQTHVNWVGDVIQPSHPLSSPSQLFASGGQRIGASASVFPVNIQGWLPSGLIGFTISYTEKKENSMVHELSSLHNIMNITSLWPKYFWLLILKECLNIISSSNIEENVTWQFTRSADQSNCFYTWIMTIRFIKLDKNSISSKFLKSFQNCYLSWVLKKKDISIKIRAK